MIALKTAILAATALLGLTAAAQAAPSSICYVNDGYVVSVTTDLADFFDEFSITAKPSPDAALPCPLPYDAANLEIGQDQYGYQYEDLLPHHLVLEFSTGPIGNVMVIDLRSRATVLDVSGTYYYTADDGLHYWQRGAEGTPETCPQYAEITANGLGTGILEEMVLNLETLETTATGVTDCEGIS